MPDYPFATVDVFTSERFGGNPLAVFYKAQGLSDAEMQSLSAEMNLSETSFVLPAQHSHNTARVRIFNRTREMPFAGHPNVGTGYVLNMLGMTSQPTLRFEERAGTVEVRLTGQGAEIDAPQPLAILGELPIDLIAQSIGVSPADIVTSAHRPVRATTGVDFVLVEVEPAALSRAAPDPAAFRRAVHSLNGSQERLSIFLYATRGPDVQARMFAPLAGTWEDAATGSANATLAALRLSLSSEDTLEYEAMQGLEMGRPSHLRVRAWRSPAGIRASVGGNCVPVFRGSISL